MVAIGVVLRFLPIVLMHEPRHSENLNMLTICAHVYYLALVDHAIINVKKCHSSLIARAGLAIQQINYQATFLFILSA